MSYRGRPSKGCDWCRARKVKCDETKPTCNRCSKGGHECRYRNQSDLMFRNQTASAAQKAEESWRKRSKSHQRAGSDASSHRSSSLTRRTPSSDASSPYNDSQCSDLTLERFNSLAVGPSISLDLHRVAYERFVYDWVVVDMPSKDPSEPSEALFDWIPPLYERSGEGSCLASIVDALSFLNFSHRCNAPQAEGLAEELIGRGIKLLQAAIADPQQAITDETLAAVYLMGVYENLSNPIHTGSFIAHQGGANALLQLRTVEEFYSNTISARLFLVSYAQMLIGNLHEGKHPPVALRTLDAVGSSLSSMSGMYVMQLIRSVAVLNADWHAAKQVSPSPEDRETLRQLLETALELDARYQAWEDGIPSTWRYQIELNTTEVRRTFDPKWQKLILEGRGAPKEIHTFSSLKKVWIWNFYRTSRMFLLRILLEILNLMLRLPEPQPPLAQGIKTLDSGFLRTQHAFATTRLVNILEKSCSSIISYFTAPLWGKSTDDVSGVRGYTPFWGLGVMNSIMKLGLIPDSGPPDASVASPAQRHQNLNSVHYVHPTAYHFTTPMATSMSESSKMVCNQVLGLPLPQAEPSMSATNQNPNNTVPRRSVCHSRNQSFDFSVTNVPSIDVAGRQEWIHRILYYLDTELGIRKALAMLQQFPGWKPV